MLIFFQNLESKEVNGYDLVEIEGVSTVVVESESFRENRASYCKQRSNPNEVIWAEEFSSGKLDKEIWDEVPSGSGTSAAYAGGILVSEEFAGRDIWVVLVTSGLVAAMLLNERKITKTLGMTMVTGYLSYMVLLYTL